MLSTIIPCYNDHENVHNQLENLSKYLDLHSFEVIVVDDSSPKFDLDFFSSSKETYRERLTLIRNTTNLGPGPSRNTGIDVSKGTFLCFLDSDDILDEAFFFYYEEIVRDNDFDVAIFKHHFQEEENAPYSFKMLPLDELYWDKLEAFDISRTLPLWQVPFMTLTVNYPWNKIYRREHIVKKGIRFPNLDLHEDVSFHWISLMSSRNLFLAAEYPPLYVHNRIPSRNRATEKADLRRLQFIDASRITWDYISSHDYLRMYFPLYLRFFLDVASWIGGILPHNLRIEFEQEAKSFLRNSLSPSIQSYVLGVDLDLSNRVTEYVNHEA